MQLLLMLYIPPDAAAAKLMYETGLADGKAWAKEQGWPGLRRA